MKFEYLFFTGNNENGKEGIKLGIKVKVADKEESRGYFLLDDGGKIEMILEQTVLSVKEQCEIEDIIINTDCDENKWVMAVVEFVKEHGLDAELHISDPEGKDIKNASKIVSNFYTYELQVRPIFESGYCRVTFKVITNKENQKEVNVERIIHLKEKVKSKTQKWQSFKRIKNQ
ncbi:hypothetical protein [Paenibacillus sp. NEAU-GSW1]|uniref:hypothetical protein n=1 Tax=Paenibacillus sp. NEAU-GSW1 TaxID=2682486 RepID=UPI0012E30F86|nr:hypothetical protein [Paenibacillus sp. NEAU-GSW1]MUT68497.1 hypothetical protein [Paenibacillus sp. NEAU-GSW1]